MCVELLAAGVPLKADRDQAWRDFAGWRANYDTVLVALAARIMAPPGKWSSDRGAQRVQPRLVRRFRGRPGQLSGASGDRDRDTTTASAITGDRREQVGDRRCHAGPARLEQHPTGSQAADEAADVAADGDAGHGEGDHQVDGDERADARAPDVDAAVAHADGERAEEAEGGARGADR